MVSIVVLVIALRLKKELDANSMEQQHRNMERVMRAMQSTTKLPFPATFITYDKLREVGHLPSHEEARGRGSLHVIDTWDALLKFTQDVATLFVSQYVRRS